MSDLTPPASTHNTPQRNPEHTAELEAPASPTSMRGGSTAPVQAGGEQIGAGSGPSGDLNAGDTLGVGVDGTGEEGGHPSFGGMEIDEPDAGGSETEDDQVEEGVEKDGVVAGEDGKAAAGDGLARPKGKGKKAGKKGKDADLYESEIVERWNKEFGDVCLAAPTKA